MPLALPAPLHDGAIPAHAELRTSLAALVLAIYLAQTPFLQSVPVTSDAAANEEGAGASQEYEVFSAQRLEELQSAGKPVFVNMTAAWCITCLANEQTTLGTERVKAVMADRGITYMKGDWITKIRKSLLFWSVSTGRLCRCMCCTRDKKTESPSSCLKFSRRE